MVAPLRDSRILVPLDGSALAERALVTAACVARATQSGLILARVLSPARLPHELVSKPALAEAYAEYLVCEERDAEECIARTAGQVREQGIAVETVVRHGAPAATLLELADELDVRLVVMLTHARSGMAHGALGSVADQLIRRGKAPMLLVRPFVETSRCADLHHAVVPLDGSAVAEAALDVAISLAGSVVQDITLLRVTDPASAHDEQEFKEQRMLARAYLDGAVARVLAEHAQLQCSLCGEVAQGSAARTIVARAKQDHAMVIMATRGESGSRRWFFGSVADYVLRNADTPVLLVHPVGRILHRNEAPKLVGAAE